MRFVEIGFEYNFLSPLVYAGLLINIFRVAENFLPLSI